MHLIYFMDFVDVGSGCSNPSVDPQDISGDGGDAKMRSTFECGTHTEREREREREAIRSSYAK